MLNSQSNCTPKSRIAASADTIVASPTTTSFSEESSCSIVSVLSCVAACYVVADCQLWYDIKELLIAIIIVHCSLGHHLASYLTALTRL